MSNMLKELRDNLELLPMSELRSRAVTNFGLRLTREETKDDIINKIIGAASKQNYAKEATGDVPEPGWTRLQIHAVSGKAQFPTFVAINGYQVYIPFNVPVDVPTKIVGVLKDAQENKLSTDEYGNKRWAIEQSYPFSVIHTTPGPDPRPGFEVARERKIAAKREFAEREGYWPKDSEIKDLRVELSRARLIKEVSK